MALSGDTAVVSSGVYQEYTGMARLYRRIGGQWQRTDRFDPPVATDQQWFGYGLALQPDTLLIAAPYLSTAGGHGAVYEYGSHVPETSWPCTATPNWTGEPARLTQAGCSRRAVEDWELVVDSLPISTRTDLVIAAPGPERPFLDGTLCLSGPFLRLPTRQSDSAGVVRHHVDFTSAPASTLVAGVQYGVQAVYRDSLGGPSGANLSNALVVEFRP